MAVDQKISEMAVATLSGTEMIEIVQGGVNKRTDPAAIAALAAGGVTSVNAQTGIVVLDAGDVGADPAGTAATLVAAATVGLWDDRGTFDASVAAYPSSGGSGTAGAILKGDIWTISVAGTLPTGQVVEIGDTVRALIDTPGNTQANWGILQNNIGYVPQPSDQDLTDIAGLTPSNDDIIQRKAGVWVNRTMAQLAGDLTGLATAFVETATIYVDAAGSDSTGILGRADKPFLTITAALAAGVGVASLRIKIGMGTFVSPASANLRGNLWLEGSGKPGYNNTNTLTTPTAITITDPTALLGGTILQGQVFFQDDSNVHVTDLGVDCGSAYVTGGGTEGNQLIFLSATLVTPWLLMTNIVIKNVTTLGRTAASAFHAIQVENGFKPIIENCDTYFSTHGIVVKSFGGIINNVRCNFHTEDAIIIKTDTYAIGWLTQLNNFEVQGGGGVRVNIGTGLLAATGGIGCWVTNGILRSPTFGVVVESTPASFIHYSEISNVKVHGSTGVGFNISDAQSCSIHDNMAIACTTGFLFVGTIGNTYSHIYNNLAEACTTGYNITGGASGNVFVRDNAARANTTGYVFGTNVFGSGNDGDTNSTFQTGTIISQEQARVFIGSSSATPTALLHVNSGATTLAPFKIASGSLLTTPEESAIEFLTDKWYLTITTGAARKEFTLNDAALTSGRVSFSTTNGRQTDSSALTFAGSTLTATQLQIGTGATVTGHLTGTGTLNFGSIAAGANEILTITVTGSADGDVVMIGVPNGSMTAGLVFTAWVSAANTVSVQCYNSTAGALDPASGTFRASVIRY